MDTDFRRLRTPPFVLSEPLVVKILEFFILPAGQHARPDRESNVGTLTCSATGKTHPIHLPWGLGVFARGHLLQANNTGSERLRVPLRKSSVFYGIFVAKILFPIRESGRRKSHDFRYESRNLTIFLWGLRVLSEDAACSVKRA